MKQIPTFPSVLSLLSISLIVHPLSADDAFHVFFFRLPTHLQRHFDIQMLLVVAGENPKTFKVLFREDRTEGSFRGRERKGKVEVTVPIVAGFRRGQLLDRTRGESGNRR